VWVGQPVTGGSRIQRDVRRCTEGVGGPVAKRVEWLGLCSPGQHGVYSVVLFGLPSALRMVRCWVISIMSSAT
jgi:hypothetical protein